MRSTSLVRTSDNYVFNPLDLDQFRIFELKPSSDSAAPLVGSVHHVNLAGDRSIKTYGALSYAWGSPQNTECVYIDGRIFRVWTALYAALLVLRRVDAPLFLFVDAICINMRDSAEHSSQVKLLKDIFQGADEVSIWLGDAQEDTPATFRFFERLNTTLELDDLLRTEEARTALLGAGSLLSRQWFARVWTIQELVVARQATLHVGMHSIRWEVFQAAIEILDQQNISFPPEIDEAKIRKATRVLRLLKQSVKRDQHGRPSKALLSLEIMVTKLSTLGSSHPYDLIYAFLGIANDVLSADGSEINVLVAPDYNKSVQKVYLDFLSFCIEKSGSLDILFRPWVPENLCNDLPYWMQTAEAIHGYSSASGSSLVPPAGQKALYSAGGPGKSVNTRIDADGQMSVEGLVLMTIGKVASAADGQTIPTDWASFSDLSYFELCRLLLGNRDDEGDAFAEHTYRQYFEDRRLMRISNPLESEEDRPHLNSISEHTHQRLLSLSYDRRLAYGVASKDPLALVPAESRNGDFICILDGSSVPVVLRVETPSLYQLIGHCYVHSEDVMSRRLPLNSLLQLFIFEGTLGRRGTDSPPMVLYGSEDEDGMTLGMESGASATVLNLNPAKSPQVLTAARVTARLAASASSNVVRDQPAKVFRMHWICSCGHRGLDHYIERRSGSVLRIAERLRRRGVQVTLETWNPSAGFSDAVKLSVQQVGICINNLVLDLIERFNLPTLPGVVHHPRLPYAASIAKQGATPILASGGIPLQNLPLVSTFTSGASLSSKAGPSSSTGQRTFQGQSPLQSTGATLAGPTAPQIQAQGPQIVQMNPGQAQDFLMVCIKGKQPFKERCDIDITPITLDSEIFTIIKAKYEEAVPWWHYWCSLKSVQNIGFVQFTFRPGLGVDNIKADMPPITASNYYEYSPRPVDSDQPIGKDWLMHYFENPAACENGKWCLEQFAKRVDGPAVPNQHPDGRIGWGIHLEEDFALARLIIFLVIGVLSSTVIGIALAIWRRSIQDGFSVASYTIALEALAVATLQIFV